MTFLLHTKHNTTRITSNTAGPDLLVLGAIHGNEVCGALAINKVIDLFDSKTWTLQKGTITFVPISNLLAYEKGVREIDVNLNRVIKKYKKPKLYEEHLAHNIASLIEKCDWLLDIHSFHTDGEPFVFQDYDDEETKSFCKILGPDYIIRGWNEMYANLGSVEPVCDTITFAKSLGITGAVIECGEHTNPQNIDVAIDAIQKTLQHLNMVKTKPDITELNEATVITGKILVHKKKEGALVKPWRNLAHFKKGEVIAKYKDGTTERAPYNCVIILPSINAKIGDEWFYLGSA